MTTEHARRRRRIAKSFKKIRAVVVELIHDDKDSSFLQLIEADLQALVRRWEGNQVQSYAQLRRVAKRVTRRVA